MGYNNLMTWLLFAIIFFLGASVGSFVNVLIDRTIQGTDWVGGRSRCDHCKKTLTWYDMVPIVSYLFYRGRSRCCHKRLSARYPIVEFILGSLFIWWAVMGTFFFQLAAQPLTYIQPLFWLGIGVLLLVLAIADWAYGVILMPVLWVSVAWVLLYRIVLLFLGGYHLNDFVAALVGAIVSAFFIQLLRWVTHGRGMGDGDPYLMFLVALVVGWPRVIVAFLASFIVGASVGVGLLVAGIRKRTDTLPFGPFLVAGAIIALVWGGSLLRIYGM